MQLDYRTAPLFAFQVAAVGLLMPIVSIYFARCYAIMMQQSSGGLERVRWSSESFAEMFSEAWPILLALVIAFTLTIPLAVVLRFVFPEEGRPIAMAILIAIATTVVFPIVLCCGSHPQVVADLPRRIESMLRVTGMTIPFAAVAIAGIAVAARGNLGGAIGFAIFAPAAILVHARAWGRLAWLVMNEQTPRFRPAQKPKPIVVDRSIRAASPTATSAEPSASDQGYGMQSTSWRPPPSTLARQFEKRRKRERQYRARAGQQVVDELGQTEKPKPWIALAPDKIFGVLFEEGTIGVWISMALVAAVPAMLAVWMCETLTVFGCTICNLSGAG